ncbi:MAG: hypothetical protein AAF501_02850 [Pseudomonadota bacterium]
MRSGAIERDRGPVGPVRVELCFGPSSGIIFDKQIVAIFMTDETTNPTPPEPREASLAAMNAPAGVAEWCDLRKTSALKDARRQIRTVWWLLGGGVLLLLILPRLIASIDYLDATLPPDAVKDAAQALNLMVTNEAEMAAELEQAETDLKRFGDELAKAKSELAIATGNFKRPFDDPLAVWERIGPEGLDFDIFGFFTLPGGEILAAGWENTEEGRKTLIPRSTDGQTWDPVRPEGGGARIGGRLFSLAVTPTGVIIAAGYEDTEEGPITLFLRSTDGQTWDPVPTGDDDKRIGGLLYSLAVTPTGAILAAGSEDTEEGRKTLILRSTDGQTWDAVRHEADGIRLGGWFRTILSGPDGRIYADGNGAPFVRTAPGRRDEASSAVLAGDPLPDLIVPDGSATRAETLRQLTRTEEIAQERVDQQKTIVANATASLERQQTAVGRIAAANIELESALRRTEPVRQASWIGTRLAVIALIIFLVQIVVNRYRYLQRLADFYDGRAHAFRMLATAGPEAAGAMLHEVSLPDLMAGLSPEAISFGKASEPPTQQVMAAVQAALRK